MASPQSPAAVEPTKEDTVIEHCDDTRDDPKLDVERPDRFGSYAKVDPKEIALVRKLDMYMMVAHHAACPG
ncbi:putative MFS transporter [Rosellinia necatrix]|uniref:Putative MFS transporter n=1 Tax=Rosellinia necatrix TaxID=77044 RepID=A0A1S8ABT8_ROSNE|nr:putative MFS transporter [Rosellinia necatrix]